MAYDLRHQNIPCPHCVEGVQMVLVAVDESLQPTHTEGILAATCSCPLTTASEQRIECRAMAAVEQRLRGTTRSAF